MEPRDYTLDNGLQIEEHVVGTGKIPTNGELVN